MEFCGAIINGYVLLLVQCVCVSQQTQTPFPPICCERIILFYAYLGNEGREEENCCGAVSYYGGGGQFPNWDSIITCKRGITGKRIV